MNAYSKTHVSTNPNFAACEGSEILQSLSDVSAARCILFRPYESHDPGHSQIPTGHIAL